MKGLLHSLEAVVAISILIVGIATILQIQIPNQEGVEKQSTYKILEYLDDRLRSLVISENKSSVDALLDEYIDNFETVICKDCSNAKPTSKGEVMAVDYYFSGSSSADPKKLIIYLRR